MKIPDLSNFIKKLAGFIPKRDIEKLIFKILVGAWLLVVVGVVILKAVLGTQNDIEEKIMKAATSVKYPTRDESEMERYEALIDLAKYPEKIEEYTQGIKRDPFSEYKEIVITLAIAEHDFVLKAVDQIPLPLAYKGYIELPDKIIGQINWRDTTRFVELGSTLNGYKIRNISKESISAVNERGEKIKFELNKPVLGDELQAVLYDNISGKTFTLQVLSEIDDYKVIDIAPNYVILLSKGEEIRLEK